MQWITPLEPNMNITLSICEWDSNNVFMSTVQKIAIYTVIPISLIAIFEALVKVVFLTTIANTGIALINGVHDYFFKKKVEMISPPPVQLPLAPPEPRVTYSQSTIPQSPPPFTPTASLWQKAKTSLSLALCEGPVRLWDRFLYIRIDW